MAQNNGSFLSFPTSTGEHTVESTFIKEVRHDGLDVTVFIGSGQTATFSFASAEEADTEMKSMMYLINRAYSVNNLKLELTSSTGVLSGSPASSGSSGGVTVYKATLSASQVQNLANGSIVLETFPFSGQVTVLGFTVGGVATTPFSASADFIVRVNSQEVARMTMGTATNKVWSGLTIASSYNGISAISNQDLDFTLSTTLTGGEPIDIVITYIATPFPA